MTKDAFDKFERDSNRFDDEADRSDEAGAKRRAQFAKQIEKTLAVTDIEIPNSYPPLRDHDWWRQVLLPDIEANGIRERIEVTERRGRYILEHGRARLEAAKRLRHETIKVIVLGEYRPASVKKSKPRAPLPNERELVQQARAGDIEARNKLVDHYYWLAISQAYKGRRKIERDDAAGVAFDAIDKAIATWDPKQAKLSTWIGQKVQGELTTHRRNLRKQQARDLTWVETKPWIHRNRDNTRVIKLDDGRVRIERKDDPDQYVVANIKKRKPGIDRLDAVIWQEREDEESARRHKARADLRLDTLATLLTERPHFELWLKQRKHVNAQDQTIAKMLFLETHKVEWVEKIGRFKYVCRIWDANWLPNEVCEALGTMRSKLNAAVTRICKTITGFTDKELLALDDVKQAERGARVSAKTVPVPNLPRFIRKTLATIGREPTVAEAGKVVSDYWRGLIGRKGAGARAGIYSAAWIMGGEERPLNGWRGPTEGVLNRIASTHGRLFREIIQDVADAIKGRTGPDYLRLAQCIEVLKKQG